MGAGVEEQHAYARVGTRQPQIPEVAEAIERFTAAGLHVREDLPDETPYGTTGFCAFRPGTTPPATIVVIYARRASKRPDWELAQVTVYPAQHRAPSLVTTRPSKMTVVIDEFLETYRVES